MPYKEDIYSWIFIVLSILVIYENINYNFNTQEAAYIVWYCRTVSLAEKEAAWNEIIKTMPNCSLKGRLNMMEIPDFYEFLKKYIELQKKMIKMFKENDRCIYLFEMESDCGQKSYYESGVFSDYDKCMEASIAEMVDRECDRAKIRKRPINSSNNDKCYDSICLINAKGEVMEIDCSRHLNDDDWEVYFAFFGMWFDFPTPFHCGDIVYNARLDEDPFVLVDLCTWDEEKIRSEVSAIEYPESFYQNCNKALAKVRRRGDFTDMGAYGYGIIENNKNALRVYRDRFVFNYLDLELYRKPYSGKDKLLLTISAEYGKGCYGIEALLNEYTNQFLKIVCESQCSYMDNFSVDI